MINPVFALSGIGMILAGIVPVLWWRYRTLVPWRDFWAGAGMWVAAIAVKAAMDLSVSPLLAGWLQSSYTLSGIMLITGAYVGLRTGLLESGLTFLASLKTRLRRFDYQQAVAFGLGFGGAEAALLGLSSFLNVAAILAFPQMIDLVPAAQRAAILEQLSLPAVAAAAPVAERLMTIPVHVFCSALAICSARSRRASFLLASVALKTGLDGMLPYLATEYGTSTVAGIYAIELCIVPFAAASIAGLWWLRGRYVKKPRKASGPAGFLAPVAVLAIAVSAFAVLAATPSSAWPVERRTVGFDGFQGRYQFLSDGRPIGSSEFSYAGPGENGTFMIYETTNLTGGDYDISIEGTLLVTADARPVFYNMTIARGGESRNTVTEFRDGLAFQRADGSAPSVAPANGESFIIANNMISHWALMFRAIRPGGHDAYLVRLFSPNTFSGFVRTLRVRGSATLAIGGRDYEAQVYEEEGGNLNYVTSDGLLLKIENPRLEIVLSPEAGEEAPDFYG